jgi:arylsulfatase A-like enzyme
MIWNRSRRRLVLVLAVVLGSSCDKAPEGPGVALFGALAKGGFIEHGRLLELGRFPKPGRYDSSFWAPLPLIAGEGWTKPSRRGWRPLGARASLRYLGAPSWFDEPRLQLDLQSRWESKGSFRVEVSVGGSVVGEIVPQADAPNPSLPVPRELLSGDMMIGLSFDPPVPEVERGEMAHLWLKGFRFEEGSRVDVEGARVVVPAFHRDWEKELLRFSGSGGELIVPVEVPSTAEALEFDIRCRGGAASMSLRILEIEDESQLEKSIEVCRRGWRTHRLQIESLAGQDAVVSFNVVIDGAGSWLELRRPRFSLSGVTPAESDVSPNPLILDRPDIVVIILDAARARQFGFHGYTRDTTPHLDALAAESLVFEQAYSECATTSCSIPNLISGVPFLNVGTVFKGKRIPDAIVTLAEYLKLIGYRTAGLSGNPNNSAARNSHQGFDSFKKLSGAFRQSNLAVEIIESQPVDEPLFLQLHYLPPHMPYRPKPAFDLFSDPDYQGPVVPEMHLRPYSIGRKTFSPRDVEQLMGLYDGNLRMADEAISEVLIALKKAGRWDNTIVVVTSDHGEAFDEHGVFSHNSTVFEEMIHVPLLVRLPGGVKPEGVDLSSPAALADVVPTLIGRLGLPPAPEVWGVDLLRERPERYLFFRTHNPSSADLAVRSDRWKAIVRSDRQSPRLFDMRADPGEQRNLAPDRPLLLAGLTLRLRDFIVDWEQRVPQEAADVELSAEDEAMLRSLGYVE